jgi:hypothetical protein
MVNRKAIVAGLLIVIAILAIVVVASTKNPTTASDITTPNAKSPPVTQLPEQATVPTLELSDDTNSVTCQQPPTGNEYGGISGNENSPPKGTTISQELTTQYGRPTATGVCGTYWYIVGWWFNASEMAKLPAETLLHGVSPYAITSGSDGGTRSGTGAQPGEGTQPGDGGADDGNDGDENDGDGDDDDEPIAPVPEVATVLLVAIGVFMFVAWRKVRK